MIKAKRNKWVFNMYQNPKDPFDYFDPLTTWPDAILSNT